MAAARARKERKEGGWREGALPRLPRLRCLEFMKVSLSLLFSSFSHLLIVTSFSTLFLLFLFVMETFGAARALKTKKWEGRRGAARRGGGDGHHGALSAIPPLSYPLRHPRPVLERAAF